MKHSLKALLILCLLTVLLTTTAQADVLAKDDFAAVACGEGYTLALRNNGDLWAWGLNYIGQVGNGGGNDSVSREGDYPCQAKPVLVLEDVTDIAAGHSHSLAIRADGSLWGWGSNFCGQLGNDAKGDMTYQNNNNMLPESLDKPYYQTTPVKIMDNVAAVSAGSWFSLILQTDGSLWACGLNQYGQLGNGGEGNFVIAADNLLMQTDPVKVMEQVTAVAAGSTHALAVKEDGSLWAWGRNDVGQLGNGGKGNGNDKDVGVYQTTPVQIFESGVVSVAASASHSLAIMEDGALWGWGYNGEGSLLESENGIIATPLKLLDEVKIARSGSGYVLAIMEDNNLWGWGGNTDQSLNFNFKADNISATPRKIMDNVLDVSTSGMHTMAVMGDGTLWGWGDNSYGQLGQEPGPVGLPVRVQVEYPAWPEEPEEEAAAAEAQPEPEPEALPIDVEYPNPLPFIIGLGVLAVGGVTGLVIWRKKRKGAVGEWRK